MVKHNLSRNFEPHPPPTLASSSNDIPLVVNVSVRFFKIVLFLSRRMWFSTIQKKKTTHSKYLSLQMFIYFSICFTLLWTVNCKLIFRRSATSYTYKKKIIVKKAYIGYLCIFLSAQNYCLRKKMLNILVYKHNRCSFIQVKSIFITAETTSEEHYLKVHCASYLHKDLDT